ATAVQRPLARSRPECFAGLFPSANAVADHQRLSYLSPRPGPVGPGVDLRRPAPVLLRQHAPFLSAGHQPGLPKWGESVEPDGHRIPVVCLYRSLYLSDAEPGRAQVLDSGTTAAAARATSVGRIRLFGERRARDCGAAGDLERPAAGHGLDGD